MAQLFPWILPQASSVSGQIDFAFWLITAVALAFFVGVSFFIILFCVRYRAGNKVNRVLPHHEGITLEMLWTAFPLFIAMGLFLVSTVIYFQTVRAPKDATEIFVVGKQWMWKIQHPNGRWEMNEIHVPVGRPVKLTMISEDVIHDFGLPSFRLNTDVVPGRYTQMWFNPTRVGRYHIFCAQYCGTNHAIMGGYVTVMEPGEFEKWMQTGNVRASNASAGERLFRENGCTGCHGPNANVRAPNLAGLYGKYRPVQIPGDRPWSPDLPAVMVKADYRYLHDSIWTPAKEVAAGYKPIMPSFAGRLNEEQVLQIIDYLKTLSTSNGTSNGSALGYDPGTGDVLGGAGTGNAVQQTNASDARTGKLYGGSFTGDMANELDREATYVQPFETGRPGDAATGRLYGGSPTGDMANERDRENIFHGGGAANNLGTIDRSRGGMRTTKDEQRGGIGVYNTDNYIKSQVRDITGGLKSQVPAGAAPNQY